MENNEKEVFQNIDFENKVISEPAPDKIKDIDTKNNIYDNIISAQERGTLDISSINSFTSISKSRDQIYSLLDMMGEDPIISSALEIYASDATETNDQGQVMWASSSDENISAAVQQILDSFNVDKNAYSQMYALCKYGDLYLRLYRKSEFNADDYKAVVKNNIRKLNEDVNLSEEERNKLKEDLILKIYSKNDKYAEFAEQVKNPAEIFDLVKFGKTCAYIKTNIVSSQQKDNIVNGQINGSSIFNYKLDYNDIEIFGAMEYVHACLEDASDRTEESVTLFNENNDHFIHNNNDHVYDYQKYDYDNNKYNQNYNSEYDSNISGDSYSTGSFNSSSFAVKRGKSILYDSFKAWRELSLLENSVLLNRLTKSSILRTINVEVGDMGKTEVQTLLRRIKTMVEQKSAYSINTSMQDYVNPGPAENILYFPVHDGKGAVTAAQIGGDVEVGDLNDLDYWKKKVFASLGIPGQYLGDTDDATGFNGGTSLSLISSRYAKNIKRIQNAFIQMYTDAVNLVLLDRGQKDYINKFTLHMQHPATQEERDRQENMSNAINSVRETMSLLDDIEDRQTKLEILKSLLSNVITNQEVIGYIQDEIDKLEVTSEDEVSESDSFDYLDTDFNDEPIESDLDFDTGAAEEVSSEPLDISAPEESFYSGTGSPLNETNDLPTWNSLGVSFTDVR